MAELPNSSHAVVPRSKLLEYLLSTTHPVGRHNARVLRALGFDRTNIAELERELLDVAQRGTVIGVAVTPYGMKYVIDGTIHTPNRGTAGLRTVWIIEAGESRPRLVTVYPESGSERT